MPVPGRTRQVTCDHTGRIVDFVMDEGKGEMKDHIIDEALSVDFRFWQSVTAHHHAVASEKTYVTGQIGQAPRKLSENRERTAEKPLLARFSDHFR